MAINLEIVTPDIDLGIFKKLLGEKTHFIYELVQNADDSESNLLGLRLYENELFIWNDGRPFSQEDVQSICSTGSSDKDLTQIGNFGIGFKSVYNYTDLPEIYSNDVCFRVPYLKKPEAIDMDPRVAKLLDKSAIVVFRLPFKDDLLPEDITNLENHLCNLEKRRSLLFLRHLTTIQWCNKKIRKMGFYFSDRPDKSRNPPEVELRASINGEDQCSEAFLVFRKEIRPREDVISRLQNQAGNWKEKDRIQRSGEELQSIEVAFKLQEGKITTLDNCVLFAYLPTEIKTDLRFLIQARYQTTPPRDNIINPNDSLWNRWLLEETANFLPEILEQLKAGELLEPAFFNVLPLKGEVENEFKPIAKALKNAMKERALIPTEKEGHYAKAENVFYPDTLVLRKLVKSSGMHSDSSLLHPYIRKGTIESGRCFDVMAEAGVKQIDEIDLLSWLEKQSFDWFKNRTDEWLRSLYIYFNRKWSESDLERIKKLPLVRLESEQHVCTNDQLVFFPPGTDEGYEEIKPFLNALPILQTALLEGDEHNNIEAFLKSLEVRPLRPEDLIHKWIIPQYSQSEKPSEEENLLHVYYLFKVWGKLSVEERKSLKGKINETSILRAYNGAQPEIFNFLRPCDVYLPKAYTGDNDLETYFSVYDGDFWFVDDKYLTNKSDTESWLQFLKAIGAMDTPRIFKERVKEDFYEECKKRGISRQNTTWTGKEIIEDCELLSLPMVLHEISEHKNWHFSQSIWSLLVKKIDPLAESERDTFFKGTYHWKYRSNSSFKFDRFDATFYRQLKSTAWIPDKQGKLHKPSECFAPTSENRELLGNSVFYLPDSFNISTGTATWLAKQLGVRVKIDDKDVLKRLRDLSGTDVSVKDVEPLYSFLYDNRPRREVKPVYRIGTTYMADATPPWRHTFKEESLIFIPEPKPRWWRTDEVFWEDESAVFGNDRGYLKAHYNEHLKSFLTRSLEVPECAGTLHYIRGIKGIKTIGRAKLSDRKRLKILYRSLWMSLQKDSDWRENEEWIQVREDNCWLGKIGDEWGFFSPQELVWRDDDLRSDLFKDKVRFWPFSNGLLEFAKELGVKGCYQNSDVKFSYCGNQEEDIDWSAKVCNLDQDIYNFLHSPHLCGEREEEKSAKILTRLSVRRVEKLEVKFELKEISVPDPNPRQSFLEKTGQEATLWLASEADKNQYAWLIGDALEEYFGEAKELSSFVEDLLTKDREDVLIRWKRKGLRTNVSVPLPEDDSETDEEELGAPVDEKFTDEFDSTSTDTPVGESDVVISRDDEDNDSRVDEVGKSEAHFRDDEIGDSTVDKSDVETPVDDGTPEIDKADSDSLNTETPTTTASAITQTAGSGSEHETPQVNESPEIDDGGPNSTTKESGTRTYNPSGTNGTSRSGGHSLSTSSNRGSGGGHGGSGGGGESDEHRELKEHLSVNTSELDAGLKLVKVEYTFGSGDRVDLLLKDGSENPVTVEVETGFSSGTGRYVGVWQAVKYQHLAAMERDLACKQVRSILAAPEIPEDVKKKCKELGIEPIEVSNQAEDTDE